MTADYPVELEPPYRPCLLIPSGEARAPLDDGKRHTLLSRLVSALPTLFTAPEAISQEPGFEEQEPFPAVDPGPRETFTLLVPEDHSFPRGVAVDLLGALSTATFPVSFELVGHRGTVTMQVSVASGDAPKVSSLIEAYAPGVAVVPEEDVVRRTRDPDQVVRSIDLGLQDEFFLPLRTDHTVDPYVALIPALAMLDRGEFIAFQVLFTRTMNPWSRAIHNALDDGEGGCVIEDAPWFLKAATEKTRTPLCAVAVRIAAQAKDEERAHSLIRGVHPFLTQLREPGGNELCPLEDSGADAWEVVSGRLSARTGMLLSLHELAALAHLPDESVRSRELLRSRKKTVPAPDGVVGRDLLLGVNTHRGVCTDVGLALEDRFAHLWVIGGSGTGKSTLLANLVLQDVARGHGCAVFDVHGDLIDDILARTPRTRAEDVILFDPSDAEYPIGFNILRASSEKESIVLGADLVSIFRRLATSWGDTMTTVLGEAILAMLHHKDGGTLQDLRRFLVEDGFRSSWLKDVPDPELRHFWEHEYRIIGTRSVGPLIARLDGFLRMKLIRNIVHVRKPALDLREVMDSGKVFLAKLPKGEIGEENAVLLGSLLLAKVTECALMRQAQGKETRRPFFLYVDEAQHFAVPSLETLLTEGRKYRVGLTLAHQSRAQLSSVPSLESALMANAHTRMVFRVGEDDARALGKGFGHFEEADLTALGRGEAIARIGGRDRDCNLKTATPRARPGDADQVVDAIRARTRERYASPITPFEPIAVAEAPQGTVAAPAPIVATTTPLPTPTPPPPRPSAPATPGRGGQIHKYLQHLVKRLAEERGFRATLEAPAGNGQVDVLLERDDLKVAVEISVTTDQPHEEANLRKCVEAGFAKVVVVSAERKIRAGLGAFAEREFPGTTVIVVAPEDILLTVEALGPQAETKETVVRGYKVKVTRTRQAPLDGATRRAAVSAVLARSGVQDNK